MTDDELIPALEKSLPFLQDTLLRQAFVNIHGVDEPYGNLIHSQFVDMLNAGAYESAALKLLPASAVNLDVFFHGSKVQEVSCRFHDTAKLMGARAATEQIARMQKGMGQQFAEAPRIIMEDAIAQHFMEFHGTAQTMALAIASAAVKCHAHALSDR